MSAIRESVLESFYITKTNDGLRVTNKNEFTLYGDLYSYYKRHYGISIPLFGYRMLQKVYINEKNISKELKLSEEIAPIVVMPFGYAK